MRKPCKLLFQLMLTPAADETFGETTSAHLARLNDSSSNATSPPPPSSLQIRKPSDSVG